MLRTIVYIDGFNLHFGMKDAFRGKYLWRNLERLCEKLLRGAQTLETVNYFTSIVSQQDQRRDQQCYLDALSTLPKIKIHFGKFHVINKICSHCGHSAFVPVEKMTDVNIASELLDNAYADKFDCCVLISGDRDLATPLAKLVKGFPSKRIVVAFPPKRVSKHLQKIVPSNFVIGENNFRQSQFEKHILTGNKLLVSKPASWK